MPLLFLTLEVKTKTDDSTSIKGIGEKTFRGGKTEVSISKPQRSQAHTYAQVLLPKIERMRNYHLHWSDWSKHSQVITKFSSQICTIQNTVKQQILKEQKKTHYTALHYPYRQIAINMKRLTQSSIHGLYFWSITYNALPRFTAWISPNADPPRQYRRSQRNVQAINCSN